MHGQTNHFRAPAFCGVQIIVIRKTTALGLQNSWKTAGLLNCAIQRCSLFFNGAFSRESSQKSQSSMKFEIFQAETPIHLKCLLSKTIEFY